jgi:hypothetical protein
MVCELYLNKAVKKEKKSKEIKTLWCGSGRKEERTPVLAAGEEFLRLGEEGTRQQLPSLLSTSES